MPKLHGILHQANDFFVWVELELRSKGLWRQVRKISSKENLEFKK